MSADGIIQTEVEVSQPSSIASTSRSGFCHVCNEKVSKYTCPRCTSKTCSLTCTNKHKSETGCNGMRDKTDYVPMSGYNDIAMWRDLGFLREVGDKIREWGGALNLPTQEALARKEKQFGFGSRKGKEREENGKTPVIHDRLKTLTMREVKLRRNLIQHGIEILFLPKEMERHRKNKSHFDPKKQKSLLTVSLHVHESGKKRLDTHTAHSFDLEMKVVDMVQKLLPKGDIFSHQILIPVPVRPVVFSRIDPPLAPAKKPEIVRPLPAKESKTKALPIPHSSLPIKPSWLDDTIKTVEPQSATSLVESSYQPLQQEPELQAEPIKREMPKVLPREVWRVDFDMSLGEALKGTSILEWPEFELWPTSVVQAEIEAGLLQFADKRPSFDRDWKRKRQGTVEEEDEVDIANKRTGQQMVDDSDDSTSDSDSSDTSSSSSSSSSDEGAAEKSATTDLVAAITTTQVLPVREQRTSPPAIMPQHVPQAVRPPPRSTVAEPLRIDHRAAGLPPRPSFV